MTLSSRYSDIPLMKQRLFRGARSHTRNRVYVGVLAGLWIQTWKCVLGRDGGVRERNAEEIISSYDQSKLFKDQLWKWKYIFHIKVKLVLSCTCIIYVALRPRARWTSAEGKNTSPRFVWSTNARYIIASALGKSVLWAAISCSAALSFHRRPLQSEPQH